jgi:hypothetical protein
MIDDSKIDLIIEQINKLTVEDKRRLLVKAGIITPEGIYNSDFTVEEVVQRTQREMLSSWAKNNKITYLDELLAKLEELKYSPKVINHFKEFKEHNFSRHRWYEYEIMIELDIAKFL